MGHIVSREGVKDDSQKIQSIKKWPIPKNIKSLRVFMGFTGYYQKFVKNYGHISTPLISLLTKKIICMTYTSILATHGFGKRFII